LSLAVFYAILNLERFLLIAKIMVENQSENTTQKTPQSSTPEAQTPLARQSKKFKPERKHWLFVGFLLLALVAFFSLFLLIKSGKIEKPRIPGIRPTTPISEETKVEKFESEEAFKAYLQEGLTATSSLFGKVAMFGDTGLAAPRGIGAPEAVAQPSLEEAVPLTETVEPSRVSETTVQVKGIDEPDIVKTDGTSIYYSSTYGGIRPVFEQSVIEEGLLPEPPTYYGPETKIIKAFPPADLAKLTAIEKTGDLLLADKVLVVFSGNDIFGYDVANPAAPSEKWKFELESTNQIVTSRLYQGKIYLVTQSNINTGRPCPIPLKTGATSLEIACTDVYHPRRSVPVDVTYTALILNLETGAIEDKVSFVGSSGTSVVYMSENAIYITYSYYGNIIDYIYNFYREKAQDLISQTYLERLNKLRDYEISDTAKFMELQIILGEYQNSLSVDERRRVENETTNRMDDYAKEHARELEKTGLVKIDIDSLDVSATGGIPGSPLNQFSLDEYQNYLRITTTIGGAMFGSGESANDVYVLDKNMEVVGQVLDLGLSERIYSVRFIEEKGYVVTFKQIDPFYVLDLSNPKNPQLKGELKIPGYSSYLHPISKDKILGIGKEGTQVKVSLFDVSLPENPSEASKYLLDEYWSDILNTHHAFLLDAKHNIFFLPGSRGGYVFSYQNDELSLERAVSDINARRAIYINDYLYIIGGNKLVVLNEIDWTEANSLTF
jgi:inhibitor of cysteine peptidase